MLGRRPKLEKERRMLKRNFSLSFVLLSALVGSAGCGDDTDEPDDGGQAGSKNTAGSKSDGGSKNTAGSKSDGGSDNNGGTRATGDAGTGASAGDASAGAGPVEQNARYLFGISVAGDGDNGAL